MSLNMWTYSLIVMCKLKGYKTANGVWKTELKGFKRDPFLFPSVVPERVPKRTWDSILSP